MRVAFVCVLSLAALATSQRPAPCTAPSAWTGIFFVTDTNSRSRYFGDITYDAANLRIAYEFEMESAGQRNFYIDILIFTEQVRYRVTFDPKTCTKEPLTDKFRPIHIPANATFLDEFYIGSSAMSDGGVLVEQWTGNTTEPAGVYEILVTQKGCIPVTDFFFDETRGDVIQSSFFDVVEGVRDPNVFIPPDDCN